MTIKKYKKYTIFIISIVFFLITVILSIIAYLDFNGVEVEKIEVSLPVINWNDYSDLSKQY